MNFGEVVGVCMSVNFALAKKRCKKENKTRRPFRGTRMHARAHIKAKGKGNRSNILSQLEILFDNA